MLCTVGTAAGPLRGDELRLELRLRSRARATLVAAGASIAQGRGDGRRARVDIAATLDEGAVLVADPGPLVACAGTSVDVTLSLALAASAFVSWPEVLVLGRSAGPAGAASVRWDAHRAGRAVLRQFVDLRDPRLLAWPGLVAGARVVATQFVCGPQLTARTVVRSPMSVAQRVDEHTMLLTVLGSDAAVVTGELDKLVAAAITGSTVPDLFYATARVERADFGIANKKGMVGQTADATIGSIGQPT